MLFSRKLDARSLFLIDGTGALLSAALLGLLLFRFQHYVGIPSSALALLIVFPLLFAAYDMYCYRQGGRQAAAQLRIIASANIGYCCLSLGLLFFHIDEVLLFGWLYIVSELLLVLALAALELSLAKRIGNAQEL